MPLKISRFVIRSLTILALFLLLTVVVDLIWTRNAALVFYAVCVTMLLCFHLIQIALLLIWVDRPKLSTVPRGFGIWRYVFTAIGRNARSRKRRKRKINIILQRFYKVTSAMPNGVLILDYEGRIEWMNALAMMHFNLTELDDQQIFINLIRVPDLQEYLEAEDFSDPITIIVENKYNDGIKKKYLSISCTQFDKNSKLVTSQDVTKLVESDNSRADFVANVSHELRTPLTVINGFVETMLDNSDIEQQQQAEFLILMQREGQRMQSLLSDLLILSKLENNFDEKEIELINLAELCRQLVKDGKTFSDGKHQISGNIIDNVWMAGIYHHLYNGLSNIVFNAIRYTPVGGSINIVLQIDSENSDKVYFAVEDNGVGIAAEHIPRLTERFYRIDKSRSRQTGGTGLGLAITKHALAMHGASLNIISVLGEGSVFSTTFDITNSPISLNDVHEENDISS